MTASVTEETRICAVCGRLDTGSVCSGCGNPLNPTSPAPKELLYEEIAEAIPVDRRVLATARDLFFAPVRITRAYMMGDRFYLRPIKLYLTLAAFYVLALSFAVTPFQAESSSVGTADTVVRAQGGAGKALPPELVQERRQSRMQTAQPILLAMSALAAVPFLVLLDRRRTWAEHLMFVFGSMNVTWAWAIALLPTLLVGYWVHVSAVAVTSCGLSGGIFWQLYRRRSVVGTIAALFMFYLVFAVASIVLLVPAVLAVELSLSWF